MRKSKILTVLLGALLTGNLLAGVPTKEERIKASGLNPENNRWWPEACCVRFLPMPKPKKKGDPWPTVCFRYDFGLPAKVREAKVTLAPNEAAPYKVYINGKLVLPELPVRHTGIRNLDIGKYLKKGHNVIAYETECFRGPSGLRMQGMVFCDDGSIKKLVTDNSWHGGYNLPEDWKNPAADPKKFNKLQALKFRNKPVLVDVPPAYNGPVRITPGGMREPIFTAEKPAVMDIKLMNLNKPGVKLDYEVFNEMTRKTVNNGCVELKPSGKLDLTGSLKLNLPMDTYLVKLKVTENGKQIYARDYEIAMVGKIKQRLVEGTSYTDGMDLKKIWSVNCADTPKPGEFITWAYRNKKIKSVVKKSPLGKYRTFPKGSRYCAFGYKFKVKNLYVPHLVEIEWPDNAPRAFLSQIYEGTTMIPRVYPVPRGLMGTGYQRGDTGFFSCEQHPRPANTMRKSYYIYWPNEEDACVFIYSPERDKAPAAASKITVYEITNDLPALNIPNATDRMIGYHTERGPQTMSSAYYAGPYGAFFSSWVAGRDHPEFLRNWYITTRNMVKRMKFSGQNLYLQGHHMYGGVLYPSKRYIFSPNCYGGGDARRDYISVILRMFEENSMSMISNIEYTCTLELNRNLPTEAQIRAGAPTWLSVNRHGKVMADRWMVWLNYHHPKVQKSMFTLVDELLELYKDYPAWKGIGFILTRWFGGPIQNCWYNATDSPLDWGYEDYTVNLFEKETGTKIPVDKKDPKRFSKRYDWLMANAKQKWIDWRCKKYTELFKEFRNRIVKVRPDLKLYIFNMEPTLTYSSRLTKQALELNGNYDNPKVLYKVLKNFGFDLETLRKEPSIVNAYSYTTPGTAVTSHTKDHPGLDLLYNKNWQQAFAGKSNNAAYIWTGMFHAGYKFKKDQWIFKKSHSRQGFPMPRYLGDALVNVLLRSNPKLMPHTWMDVVASGGRLHEMRIFARAFRTLPNSEFKRLHGNGLDKNIWVMVGKHNGNLYGYIANPHWWKLDNVSLTFAKGVKVLGLISNKPVKLKSGKWEFNLGPYGIRTFKIESGGSSAITGANAEVSAKIGKKLSGEINTELKNAEKLTVRADNYRAKLKGMGNWFLTSKINRIVSQAEAAEKSGNIGEAYSLVVNGDLKNLCSSLETSLTSIPFLVIGPFGKPEDVIGSGKKRGNTDVVDSYNGLETPYIGEFNGNGKTVPNLKPGFKPDLSKSLTVYPGKPRKWQKTLKKNYLSFIGTCGSELPYWMAAYAYVEIFVPKDEKAVIHAGSDHALAIWMNDKLVLKHGGLGSERGGQRPSQPGQDRATCQLRKGWNRMLIKAVQRGQTRIFFNITDANGNPINNIKFRIPG